MLITWCLVAREYILSTVVDYLLNQKHIKCRVLSDFFKNRKQIAQHFVSPILYLPIVQVCVQRYHVMTALQPDRLPNPAGFRDGPLFLFFCLFGGGGIFSKLFLNSKSSWKTNLAKCFVLSRSFVWLKKKLLPIRKIVPNLKVREKFNSQKIAQPFPPPPPTQLLQEIKGHLYQFPTKDISCQLPRQLLKQGFLQRKKNNWR